MTLKQRPNLQQQRIKQLTHCTIKKALTSPRTLLYSTPNYWILHVLTHYFPYPTLEVSLCPKLAQFTLFYETSRREWFDGIMIINQVQNMSLRIIWERYKKKREKVPYAIFYAHRRITFLSMNIQQRLPLLFQPNRCSNW